jgi:cell division septation protein DedD
MTEATKAPADTAAPATSAGAATKPADQKIAEGAAPPVEPGKDTQTAKPTEAATGAAAGAKTAENAADASPANKLTEAAKTEADKTIKAGAADATNLDNTGLKKSVTGAPAFATLTDAAGQGDKAGKAETPAGSGQQDATASTADKDAAKKADGEKAAEIPATTSGGEKAHLPQELPVAESLTGSDRVYRIWLASKGTADAARSEWDRLLQKYPSILKKVTPDVREYYFNTAQGSIYRLFVGPFNSLEDAQKACSDIHERYKEEFCRTVLN